MESSPIHGSTFLGSRRGRVAASPDAPFQMLPGGQPSGASLNNFEWGRGPVLRLLVKCFLILLHGWTFVINLLRRAPPATRLPLPPFFPFPPPPLPPPPPLHVRHTPHTDRAQKAAPPAAPIGKFARGPAPILAHHSNGSFLLIGSSTYGLMAHLICTWASAHFGTLLTWIVPVGSSSHDPSGQVCTWARAHVGTPLIWTVPHKELHPQPHWASLPAGFGPCRHVPHTYCFQQVALPTAPVGKFACGPTPMLAHPSHGSWPIASFTDGPRGQVCM